MDTVFIIIGTLGLVAMIIAAYVFTVAARNYVSDGSRRGHPTTADTISAPVERREFDRRQQQAVQSFPITVNTVSIESDRRQLPDRRLVA